MQNNRYICLSLLIFIFSLIGCQQQDADNPPLPTVLDLSIQATTDANLSQNTGGNLPTSPPRSGLPTLPATYTSTPPPTATEPEPSITPTSTPAGFNAAGFIYYIFNGNSIMKLGADGTGETPIFTVPVGQLISDLTLSPDKSLLAYIAPGNGSAREIFITNLDGTYRQQVSCVGFSQVFSPAWSPDSSRIAFYAAQSAGMPLSVYSASWVGSGNCPIENDQRQLVITQSIRPGGLAYSADGTQLFFSDREIYIRDLQTEAISPPLTSNLGFGPDTNFAINPMASSQLSYIRTGSSSTGQLLLGEMQIVNISQESGLARIVGDFRSSLYHFQWSNDGTQIVTSGIRDVMLFNPITLASNTVITGTSLLPDAIFSPDDSQIAYIDGNAALPDIPQVFIVNTDGSGDPLQITNHVDGSIANLAWVKAIDEGNQ